MTARVDGMFQFYYTSCERGLGGHAGYQFNAATPGAPAALVREVEPLLSYEPPPSMLRAQSAQELERCPVNLFYVPGPVMIVANVEYLGRDYTRRPGNFFAHALAAPAGESAGESGPLGPLLPIELWRAPGWQRVEAAETGLPPFTGPPARGSLTPAAVAEFLAGQPHRDLLARLATAALRAADRTGKPVLIVERDSDAVARWIAAVCYLLPSAVARRVSFATYLSRPSRSALNLLGTVPEAAADLGRDAEENFALFDCQAGRFQPGEADPLLDWLAGLGPQAARRVWSLAPVLATGAERDLADWHPLALASAALGMPLDPQSLDVLFQWLAKLPDRLAARPSDELLAAAHRLGDALVRQRLAAEHLPVLLRLARASGNDRLSGVVGQRWFTKVIDLVAAGDEQAAEVDVPGPVESGARTAEQLLERLGQAEPVPALRLLAWAHRCGVQVDADSLADLGRRVANWVADERSPRAQQMALLTAVLRNHPVLYGEMLAELARLARANCQYVDQAFAGPLRNVLTDQHLDGYPELAEARLVGGAIAHPARRAEALSRLFGRPSYAEPGPELINRIWGADWNLKDAAAVAKYLPARLLSPGSAIVAWFDQLLDPRSFVNAPTSTDIDDYLALAGELHRLRLLRGPGDLPGVHESLHLAQEIKDAATADALLAIARQRSRTPNLLRQRILRERLLPRLARLDLGAREIDTMLRALGEDIADAYITAFAARLTGAKRLEPADNARLAGLYLYLVNGNVRQRVATSIHDLLTRVFDHNRRAFDKVGQLLEAASLQPYGVTEFHNAYGKSSRTLGLGRMRSNNERE